MKEIDTNPDNFDHIYSSSSSVSFIQSNDTNLFSSSDSCELSKNSFSKDGTVHYIDYYNIKSFNEINMCFDSKSNELEDYYENFYN